MISKQHFLPKILPISLIAVNVVCTIFIAVKVFYSNNNAVDIVVKNTSDSNADDAMAVAEKPKYKIDTGIDLLERSPDGFLPKRGENDERQPWRSYARMDLWPDDPPLAMISIVVEQMGLNDSLLQQAIKTLPPQISFAFNPYAEDVFTQMQTAREGGFETLLSLAIETRNYPYSDPGSLALLRINNAEQNTSKMLQQLAVAQGYIGITPMMGQNVHYDSELTNVVLTQSKLRGLLYLDFSTGSDADVQQKSAKNQDIPYALINMRLDSVENREDFFNNIKKVALKNGSVVAIVPPYPVIFTAISQWFKQLSTADASRLAIVPISYQGKMFLDAPKPSPEPVATAEADKKHDADKKTDDKKNDKTKKETKPKEEKQKHGEAKKSH